MFVPSVSVFYFVLVTFGANIGSSLIAMRRGGIMCEGIVKKSILVHRTRVGSVIQKTHQVIDTVINLRLGGGFKYFVCLGK